MDILFVSMEDWDHVWRRNQLLCAAYAKRFPDRRILFISPPRDLSNRLRKGGLRAMPPAVESVAGFANITVVRPLKLLPNTIPTARRFNEVMTRRFVARWMRTLKFERPLLWINPYWAGHMAKRMGERAVVYDITDDWTQLRMSPRLAALVAEQDDRLCEMADAVVVCSEQLHNAKCGVAQNLHLVPNGVSVEHYLNIVARDISALTTPGEWKYPVFGYTGTIHPERVDVDLVEFAAAEMPEATLVLIGPNHLRPAESDRLARHGNVHLTGSVPYADLPGYMQAFDVCITPHVVSSFTESLNPIKLWEYLAAGLPIVSTNVAGFRDYPQFVRIARTRSEFVAHLRSALQEDRQSSQSRLRQAEAARHSWESRLDDVLKILQAFD